MTEKKRDPRIVPPKLYLVPSDIENLEDHPKMLNAFINTHASSDVPRYQVLKDYFIGNHDILKRKPKHDTDPNNTVVTNYCRLTTITKAGYLMGNGVTLQTDDDVYLETLSEIDEENSSRDKNMDLANEQSIKGIAYEIVYIAPEKKNRKTGKVIKPARPRYVTVKPEEVFLVHSNDIEPEPLFAVRHYLLNDVEYVEIYSEMSIKSFIRKDEKFILQDEKENQLDGIPIYAVYNNSFGISDFEPIMGLQDDYNSRNSDRSNLLAYANDPLLKIRNMSETQKGDIDEIHKFGAVLLEGDGDVDWLIKVLDDKVIVSHLEEQKNSIFTIANFPDWSSNDFTNALSGVAISFKLLNLAQITAISEMKLQKGMMKRYELITNWLNKKGNNFDINSLRIKYSRNVPQNVTETVSFVLQLLNTGLVSEQTLRGLLPFIPDLQAELNLLEKEKGEKADTDEMKAILDKYSQKAVETEEEADKKVEEVPEEAV